ncbi:aldose epimerase [Iningainema tapete]|uniref:Aldose epimerase n=1 Tax=Iningainema tapete BLCC-T55 TaxID=2748662 RepID=A0A8J7BWF5_9CYAN|nr:aldose epimerase [Iningainema tapete]MBD2771722.1 aldose epimerase [Iningainema tapete BLCC-T55]
MSKHIQTNQSQLEILPERGGIIVSWLVKGQEIFYLDKERLKDPQLSVRGGVPILFPICGNLPNDTYTLNGQEYKLKQHGFARDLPWFVKEDNVTPEKASVTLVLNSNEQTRAVYPFDFTVTYTYLIQGNSLEIQQQYTNNSSAPMPCSFGFHPYFAAQDKSKLEFQIPSGQYQAKNSQTVESFDGNFDFSVDEIDVAFNQLSGTSTSVVDNHRKLKLTIDYDRLFSTLVFWTVKGKDFYCLEPWSAPRNAMNTKENLSVVQPGEDLKANVRLSANFF